MRFFFSEEGAHVLFFSGSNTHAASEDDHPNFFCNFRVEIEEFFPDYFWNTSVHTEVFFLPEFFWNILTALPGFFCNRRVGSGVCVPGFFRNSFGCAPLQMPGHTQYLG
jgi:hypothetical protein